MLKKSKIVLNWYEIKEGLLSIRKKDTPLKLYKDFMYRNLKDLKKMDCYKTRNDIELIVKNISIRYPYNEDLYNIYINNIFAITLGMIDAKINYYNSRIESSIRQNVPTGGLIRLREEILNYKQTIIKDIDQFIPDDNNETKKLLKTTSSHTTIEDLYEYMRTNKSDYNVKGELLSAYIYGYNKFLVNDNEKMFLYYKKVISNFRKTKDKNEYCIQKVKYLNKKK